MNTQSHVALKNEMDNLRHIDYVTSTSLADTNMLEPPDLWPRLPV